MDLGGGYGRGQSWVWDLGWDIVCGRGLQDASDEGVDNRDQHCLIYFLVEELDGEGKAGKQALQG